MKTLKLKDKAEALRRTYPNIDPATLYMYDGKLRKSRRGTSVALHVIAWSEDRRVTLHQTVFRKNNMNVTEWSAWLREHAPKILYNQVRAYMGRTFGSRWNIERVFGWHFVDE